jgi:hypothetical protein
LGRSATSPSDSGGLSSILGGACKVRCIGGSGFIGADFSQALLATERDVAIIGVATLTNIASFPAASTAVTT